MSQMQPTVVPPHPSSRTSVPSPSLPAGRPPRRDAAFDAALDRAERRDRGSDRARIADRADRRRDRSEQVGRGRDQADDDAPTTPAPGVATTPRGGDDDRAAPSAVDPASMTPVGEDPQDAPPVATVAEVGTGVSEQQVLDHLQVHPNGDPDAEADLLSSAATRQPLRLDAETGDAGDRGAVDAARTAAPRTPSDAPAGNAAAEHATAGHNAAGRATAGPATAGHAPAASDAAAGSVAAPRPGHESAGVPSSAAAGRPADADEAAAAPIDLGADGGAVDAGVTEGADVTPRTASTLGVPDSTSTGAPPRTAAAPGPVAGEPSTAAAGPSGRTSEPTDPPPGLRAVELAELGDRLGATLRRGERVQTLSIQLHPAELGAIKVEARLVDGVTHVTFTPDSSAATERLASTLSDLRHQLTRAGVDVGDLDLSGHGREPADRGPAVPRERPLVDATRARVATAPVADPPGPIDHRGGAVAIDL